jgi:muramoyltetrapeptide carboxypeptidase
LFPRGSVDVNSAYFSSMITPPLLAPGDKIGIVAPGRKVSSQDIDEAKKIFTAWGLQIILSDNLHNKNHSYLSGSDEDRLCDLQRMVGDPDIKAIISARGGYGTTRILDKVDFTPMERKPKWVIGFSDITAIHLKLFKLGIKSIHGTMPILFSNPSSVSSVESLRRILTGENQVILSDPNKNNRLGKATAPIMGGNLSLIVDSIGTSSDPDTNGKILVLEEIDEYFYRVDRMIMHLRRSGKLDNLAGLIVGHMTDMKELKLPFGESIQEIILNKTQHTKYPIAFGFPIGHENPNMAWVHGSVMTLTVSETGSQLTPVY